MVKGESKRKRNRKATREGEVGRETHRKTEKWSGQGVDFNWHRVPNGRSSVLASESQKERVSESSCFVWPHTDMHPREGRSAVNALGAVSNIWLSVGYQHTEC